MIVLEKPGTREAYFVDNLGFESIPDFFKGLSEPDRKEKPMDPARPIAFDILISEIKEKLPKRWF